MERGSVTAHGNDKSKDPGWRAEVSQETLGEVGNYNFFNLIILHPSRDSLALWDSEGDPQGSPQPSPWQF